jgi:excisionase family DNA binding protein
MARKGNNKIDASIEEIRDVLYLDVAGLSKYIPRSPGAIRNLVLRRVIPFHKPGGRLLFIKNEIDEWIKQS